MKVEDELPRLIKALALSQRFHLYIAHCASPRAADRLFQALENELPTLRGSPVHVVRLEPYAEKLTDAPLTNELLETVLVPLLDAPAELRGHGTIHVVDASRASSSDDDTWAKFFASWNEKRNLLQRHKGEVIIVLPRALALVFATDAPDVWSIRSGEYEISDANPQRLERVQGNTVEHSVVSTRSVDDLGGDFGESGTSEGAERASVPIWRLLPPLALFGGDIAIEAWTSYILQDPRLAPDSVRSLKAHGPRPSLIRLLRDAEYALAAREFLKAKEALELTSIEAPDIYPEERVRILVALAVSLAALDRGAEATLHIERLRAITNIVLESEILRLGASAYVAWCTGALKAAEISATAFDGRLRDARVSVASRFMRAMEYGAMKAAEDLVARMVKHSSPRDVVRRRGQLSIVPQLVATDYQFLFDGVSDARRDLEDIASVKPQYGYRYVDRARPLAALYAVLDHDHRGARRLLQTARREASSWPEDGNEPTSVERARRQSLLCYVGGIVEMASGNRAGALAELDTALHAMTQWSAAGLERRSLHRAITTTLLAAASVDLDRARALQHVQEAEQLADWLLGDPGEDCMARVLAVESRWARARLTSDAALAQQLAREAIELAQPLRATGVESWTALADRRLDDLPPSR
ncbi:MAG TPA: hypothetical protein VFP84_17340 [Kofleriaceae bacterium]|nr:hypothetical protein [Kofleriaceae bacterium]